MGRMHGDGTLDETMLGNLIYMVEMGRDDLRLLFRWLSKYAAENPPVLERIRAGVGAEWPDRRSLAEAFVLETLRLNQSEALLRVVDRDIVFQGYLIPAKSLVRLCLWESHKQPESFPEPFSFMPDRFLNGAFTRDQYAPFGLGSHSCPFADIAVSLSSVFVRVLAQRFTVRPIANCAPVKGEYHWQPAHSFSVHLMRR